MPAQNIKTFSIMLAFGMTTGNTQLFLQIHLNILTPLLLFSIRISKATVSCSQINDIPLHTQVSSNMVKWHHRVQIFWRGLKPYTPTTGEVHRVSHLDLTEFIFWLTIFHACICWIFLLALQYLFQTNAHLLPYFKLQCIDTAEDQPANFFARPSGQEQD